MIEAWHYWGLSRNFVHNFVTFESWKQTTFAVIIIFFTFQSKKKLLVMVKFPIFIQQVFVNVKPWVRHP